MVLILNILKYKVTSGKRKQDKWLKISKWLYSQSVWPWTHQWLAFSIHFQRLIRRLNQFVNALKVQLSTLGYNHSVSRTDEVLHELTSLGQWGNDQAEGRNLFTWWYTFVRMCAQVCESVYTLMLVSDPEVIRPRSLCLSPYVYP